VHGVGRVLAGQGRFVERAVLVALKVEKKLIRCRFGRSCFEVEGVVSFDCRLSDVYWSGQLLVDCSRDMQTGKRKVYLGQIMITKRSRV
jgi:hypothetical protein